MSARRSIIPPRRSISAKGSQVRSEEAVRQMINRRKSPAISNRATPNQEEDGQRFTDFLMRQENSDKIGIKEIKALCDVTGYSHEYETILKYLKTKDPKGTGFIDIAEFSKLIDPSYSPFDEAEGMEQAFKTYDYNKTGTIDPENIKVIAEECGEVIPEDELEEMILLFAKNGDRCVDQEEFYEIMKLAGVNINHQ